MKAFAVIALALAAFCAGRFGLEPFGFGKGDEAVVSEAPGCRMVARSYDADDIELDPENSFAVVVERAGNTTMAVSCSGIQVEMFRRHLAFDAESGVLLYSIDPYGGWSGDAPERPTAGIVVHPDGSILHASHPAGVPTNDLEAGRNLLIGANGSIRVLEQAEAAELFRLALPAD